MLHAPKVVSTVCLVAAFLVALFAWSAERAAVRADELRAGAAVADVTPQRLPVPLAGMFLVRHAEKIHSRLMVRAIVLEKGDTRVVIAVVDSVGVPREILDEAKQLASRSTGIPTDKMLISSTHTHTAPPVQMAHGTDPDLHYAAQLTTGIAQAIERAAKKLVPAKVGAAVVDAAEFAAVRRWIVRPDLVRADPFGNRTVRASMHTARNHAEVTGPSGPMDPDLSLIAVQTIDGQPIALLANFANHYAGAPQVDGQLAVSADYFGLFADLVEERLAGQRSTSEDETPFVALMSQGTSGDIATRDYWHLETQRAAFEEYTRRIAELALKAYEGIEFHSDVRLEMAQTELQVPFRTPDVQRLEWAKRVFGDLDGGRLPANQPEVYARHALYLDRHRGTQLLLQAVRLGDIGITAIPNEVYALTGLHLKELSPLLTTINIELANGSEGYLPPPEQHTLGGYTTWPARSSCLDVSAEPRIVEALLELLEQVSGQPRRSAARGRGPGIDAVLEAEPASYFRMHEFAGPRAADSLSRHDGSYEPGVVFYLPGPGGTAFSAARRGNRAVHFAGGRMRVAMPDLPPSYSISCWFWNGLLTGARPVTGYLLSRDREWSLTSVGDHLGIGGAAGHEGLLIYHSGTGGSPAAEVAAGRTQLARWRWYHVVFVRDGDLVRVFLDGHAEPEIEVSAPLPAGSPVEQLFIGGRSDNSSNFEGRIDEVALFDRALSGSEVRDLYSSAAD